MVLTDRRAADMRASEAVGKAHQTLSRHMQMNRHNAAMAFRNGLREALPELSERLVELYSQLSDAPEERDELVDVIVRQVTSFITSAAAGQRGSHIGSVAREASNQTAAATMGIPNSFDLAVHEHRKKREAAAPVRVRRKQDKFEILDSPREYEPDFIQSVGVLGVSVIFFDVDDFKEVNTRFTEPVIDRTLLSELMRMIWALAEGRGFAYAEGGDEFVITLPNTNTTLAEAFTALLLEQIRSATFDVDGQPVKVTASAGIASSMSAGDGQACREAAGAAKRDAKNRGKAQCLVSALRT